MKIVIFILFAIGFSSIVSAEPISTTVDGGYSNGKQLQCKVYLSKPKMDNHDSPKLLFNEPGTGVYTTYFNHTKNVHYYYLTMDKPGILPDLQNPKKPLVDRSQFDYYTISTLINCAQNALYWADDYLKDSKPSIIVQGHSEGTSVMANVIYRVYSDNNKKQLQDNIKALFLSGVVVQNMSDVMAFQFKGEALRKLMTAYKKHDSNYLFTHFGVNWYWLDEVLYGEKSKVINLSALTELTQVRLLPIEILQGLNDEDVPTKAVQEFEKINSFNPDNKKLNLHVRYYYAGHNLNESTLFDLSALHAYYFN